MAQQNLVNKPLASLPIPLAIGFWSAVIITFFNVTSSFLMIPSWFLNPITQWHGIEAYTSTFDFFQIASMLPGFLVIIPFLPMMAAIHYSSPPERRILSMLGIAFAGISVAMLGFQYYSQFTVVRYNLTSGEHQGLGLFVLGNPHSFFWPLEVLGYGFMSLSTLFAGFVFSTGVLERWIRGLFIANGVIGIAGILAYPFGISTMAFLSGLALWTLVFPASTILLAINFKQKMKTGVETVQTNTSYACPRFAQRVNTRPCQQWFWLVAEFNCLRFCICLAAGENRQPVDADRCALPGRRSFLSSKDDVDFSGKSITHCQFLPALRSWGGCR